MKMAVVKKLGDWKLALGVIAVGILTFSISLGVALALSESEGDKYIPVFLIGQMLGELLVAFGVLLLFIVVFTLLVRSIVSRRNH